MNEIQNAPLKPTILAARRGFPSAVVELRDYVDASRQRELKKPPSGDLLLSALHVPISVSNDGTPLLGSNRMAFITKDSIIVGSRPVTPGAKYSWSEVDLPPPEMLVRLRAALSPSIRGSLELKDYIEANQPRPLKTRPSAEVLLSSLYAPISLSPEGRPLLGSHRVAFITKDSIIIGSRPVVAGAKYSWSEVDLPPPAQLARIRRALASGAVL